jgi:hypothetical protein
MLMMSLVVSCRPLRYEVEDIRTSENNTLFRGAQQTLSVCSGGLLVGPGIPRSGLRPPGSSQDTYTSQQVCTFERVGLGVGDARQASFFESF